MLSRFKQSLHQSGDFDSISPLLVGVSGGADSLALLFLLHEAGYHVIAAYFNHDLRLQAEEETSYIARLAESLNIPFVHGRQDVRSYARKHGLTIEAAGRELRYEFLFAQAQQDSAQAVAVAHHADDQVETVLLHLLRGSGLHGLQGMSPYWLPNPWSKTIPLVRPLLPFWKYELEAFIQTRSVQPVQDETNLDSRYLRNRLRHEVLPTLEQIQPGLKPALLRLARIVLDEQVLLQPLEDSAWQACLRRQEPGSVVLNTLTLASQPVAMQRRICRRALALLLPGLTDVDFNAVEKMVTFLHAPPRSKQADLMAGLRLLMEGDDLWLVGWDTTLPADRWPQLPDSTAGLPVPVPGRVDLSDGWYMTCYLEGDVVSSLQQASENTDLFQTWLDFDQSGADLTLKPRWEGARFQPLGLNGQSQKVSDRMIDAHLTGRARRNWPLLCAGEQILWIPGLAAAHPARLTGETRRVLHFTIQKSDGS